MTDRDSIRQANARRIAEIDWRELFRRYAAHVAEQEGTDFLWPPGHTNFYGVVIGRQWSAEEWAAIEEIIE